MALKYSLLPYVPKKNHIVYPTKLVRLIWTDFSIKCLIQFNFTAGPNLTDHCRQFYDRFICMEYTKSQYCNIQSWKKAFQFLHRKSIGPVALRYQMAQWTVLMSNLVTLSRPHHGDRPETQIDIGIFFSNAIHQSLFRYLWHLSWIIYYELQQSILFLSCRIAIGCCG